MSIGYMVPPEEAMIGVGQWCRAPSFKCLTMLLAGTGCSGAGHATGHRRHSTHYGATHSGQRGGCRFNPSLLAQADVRRARAMFEKTNVPVLGLVENMAFMTAPDGTRMHPFGTPCNDALMSLPLDAEIHAAAETGVPVVIDAPQSAAALPSGSLHKN